ncbi:hypothetical protein ACX3YC_21230 [Pseudomonas mohnii]
MKTKILFIAQLTTLVFSAVAFSADDPYDGAGDTSSKPDVWVAPVDADNGRSGTLTMPGDNQPVESTRSGSTETLNYDTHQAPNSEPVLLDDPDGE